MDIYQACETLGVHPNDPDLQGSAHRAYRKLAKTLHPDKSGDPNTSEAFSKCTEAYETVKSFIENPTPPQQPQFGFGGFGIHVNGAQNVTQTIDQFGNVRVTITIMG